MSSRGPSSNPSNELADRARHAAHEQRPAGIRSREGAAFRLRALLPAAPCRADAPPEGARRAPRGGAEGGPRRPAPAAHATLRSHRKRMADLTAGVVLRPAQPDDRALIAYSVEPDRLRHPLCIYIPKSESAEEALWWRDALRAVAVARGWPADSVKCMALVESHPLAHQMEEFLYHLRDHILGLNLGRWDYMASLI